MKTNDKRNELYRKWTSLYNMNLDKLKQKKLKEIKEEETEYYNQWKFYDSFLKANDKVKRR